MEYKKTAGNTAPATVAQQRVSVGTKWTCEVQVQTRFSGSCSPSQQKGFAEDVVAATALIVWVGVPEGAATSESFCGAPRMLVQHDMEEHELIKAWK